jgi:hypothetical protein
MAAGDSVGVTNYQGGARAAAPDNFKKFNIIPPFLVPSKGVPKGSFFKGGPKGDLINSKLIAHFSSAKGGKKAVKRACGFFSCPAIKAQVLTNRVTQAGSQWIVAQGPLSHLQFLGATKSSAKDLPLPGLEIASDSSSL